MLKGISMGKYGNIDLNPLIKANSAVASYIQVQDTSKIPDQSISTPKSNLEVPSITATPEVDSVTQKSTEVNLTRSEQLVKPLSAKIKLVSIKQEVITNSQDTSYDRVNNDELPFQHSKLIIDRIFQENFLLSIPYKSIGINSSENLLNDSTIQRIEKSIHISLPPVVEKRPLGIDGTLRSESSFNWIAGLLLLSLFVFSWMKILYQKYVEQVVITVVNYQASVRLLREKNVLFKNMAVGLNVVFSINLGLFVFFTLAYFNVSQVIADRNFLSVLIYCFAIGVIYSVKTLSCKLIGYIFLAQDEFKEYVHNFNLFNKNIGLFLFPIVITMPYISDYMEPLVIFSGMAVFSSLFVLRTVRGFQIIIRKGVSTFYLILYLCAIEILPVLLLVKYSSTWI